MPRNGSGTYSLPNPPFVPGTIISSTVMNSNLSDIAQALTQSVAADGQTPITGSGISFPTGSPAMPGVAFQADNTTGMYYPGSQQLGFAAGGQTAMVLNAGAIGSPFLGPVITIINGAVINPVGIVQDFAGAGAGTGPPPGWFYCNGQALSRAAYPELYDTIGIGYGPGDGSTTFNLPDLRGRVVAGLDNMGGTAAGRITSIPQFTGASGGSENLTTTVVQAGGGAVVVQSTNNLQPTSMFAKIIFAGRV